MADQPAPSGPLAPLDRLLGYQLRRATSAMLADFADTFADDGMRPTQVAALMVIRDQPGISQSGLCDVLAIKRANMVALVAELEQRGLIARTADDADRRAQRLTLTADGTASLIGWEAALRAHEQRFFDRLDPAQQAVIIDALDRLWRPRRDSNTQHPA